MAKVPYPPYRDKPINPHNKVGNGANYGLLKPNGASVDHSMYGFLNSTDAYFRLRSVGSLTPWGIGGSADGPQYDGVIFRWMDYYAYQNIQPWSSGPWNPNGYGDGLAFVQKYGVAGINGVAQAIETSDGGAQQAPMSPKQWKSLIWLKAAIAHRGGLTSDTYRQMLAFMHHREFTKPSYKDCPFPRIYNYTSQYLGAVVQLMRFFEGKTDDLNSLVFRIAGLTIDMRDVGRMRDNIPTPDPKPDPTPTPKPGEWVAGASARAKKEILAREGDGLNWPVVMVIKGGDFVKLVSGEVRHANGMDWIDVLGINGSGWVPKQDLELASEETKPTKKVFHQFPEPREFTVGPGGATLRQWGNRDAAIWDNYSPGTKILMDGYYDDGEVVDGSPVWLVQHGDPRGRVHISGVREDI